MKLAPSNKWSAPAISPETGYVVMSNQRWDVATGSLVLLGSLPGSSTPAIGTAISANGKVIAGYAYVAAGEWEPFRWTEKGGLMRIGFPGRRLQGIAVDLSASGHVVVGEHTSGSGPSEAFRWVSSSYRGGTLTLLGVPPYGTYSVANAVSSDGTLVAGRAGAHSSRFLQSGSAMIWDATRGMRWVQNVLASEYGLEEKLDGWTLLEVVGIEHDAAFIY
ncbi:MAG: hypothetical protein ACREIA_03410, partial [Opitutaceae bacterium]